MYQYFDGTKFFDAGCSEADKVTGGKSKCTVCPFRHCVQDLTGMEKKLVMAAPDIRQVYKLYDATGKVKDVSTALDLPFGRVYNWISRRSQIEKKLDQYAIISA